MALRRDAVDSYLDLLETPAVPDQVCPSVRVRPVPVVCLLNASSPMLLLVSSPVFQFVLLWNASSAE